MADSLLPIDQPTAEELAAARAAALRNYAADPLTMALLASGNEGYMAAGRAMATGQEKAQDRSDVQLQRAYENAVQKAHLELGAAGLMQTEKHQTATEQRQAEAEARMAGFQAQETAARREQLALERRRLEADLTQKQILMSLGIVPGGGFVPGLGGGGPTVDTTQGDAGLVATPEGPTPPVTSQMGPAGMALMPSHRAPVGIPQAPPSPVPATGMNIAPGGGVVNPALSTAAQLLPQATPQERPTGFTDLSKLSSSTLAQLTGQAPARVPTKSPEGGGVGDFLKSQGEHLADAFTTQNILRTLHFTGEEPTGTETAKARNAPFPVGMPKPSQQEMLARYHADPGAKKELTQFDEAIPSLQAGIRAVTQNPDAFGVGSEVGGYLPTNIGGAVVGDIFAPFRKPLMSAQASRRSKADVAARAAVFESAARTIHELAGAQQSAAEAERILPFVPDVNDAPSAIRAKLQLALDRAAYLRAKRLQLLGVQPQPIPGARPLGTDFWKTAGYGE